MAEEKERDEILKKALIENTGIFLERAAAEALLAIPTIGLEREVEFAFTTYGDKVEGNVDIVATYKLSTRQNCLVCFVIECKRVYKNYKSWVFERDETAKRMNFPYVYYDGAQNLPIRYDVDVILPSLQYLSETDYDQASNVFEFNTTGKPNSDKTDKPYIAMKQANAGLTGMANSPTRPMDIAGTPRVNRIFFVPIVVTTADLFVASYNPQKIAIHTGTIEASELNLVQKNWVEFLFPLPTDLQIRGNVGNVQGTPPSKRITYVVAASHLAEFCNGYIDDIDYHLRLPS